MLAIVNGGYRTGSTLTYNLIQNIYELKKITHVDYSLLSHPDQVEQIIATHPQAQYGVMKCHVWTPKKDIPFVAPIYTIRNPYDVCYSLFNLADRKVSEEEAISEILRQKWFTELMGNYEHLNLSYDVLYGFWDTWVHTVATRLNISLTKQEINQLADTINPAKKKATADQIDRVDIKTQLRQGHILDTLGKPGTGLKNLPENFINKLQGSLLF